MSIISRNDKLKALNIESNINLDDIYVNDLYDIYVAKQKLINDMALNSVPKLPKIKKNKIEIRKVLDKSDPKYVLLLKLLNKILSNAKLQNITDIYDFKNIDRNIIINQSEANNLFDMEKEIFEHYDRTKCCWSQKSQRKYYIITFIKYACKIFGVNVNAVEKKKSVDSNIIYSIEYSII